MLSRHVDETFIIGGCILLNWPAYWSRTFWKASYPRKASFHPSGLKDAASHSQILLFPIAFNDA